MPSGPQDRSGESTILEHLGIRLDRRTGEASLAGQALKLTGAEFRLLECLLQEPGRVFSRAELIEAMTRGEAIVEDRTVNVHIAALRRKLGDPRWIETVRRAGYRFRTSSLESHPPRGPGQA
jgi:DNA-binding response OmpR family regulator